MLKNRQLDSFGASKTFHDSTVFATNVFFDNTFNNFDFIKSMVKSHNLTDKKLSFRHYILKNGSINQIESISEWLFNWANSMELRVMRPHDRTIFADKLFTRIAKMPQRQMMKEAELLWIFVLNLRTLRAHIQTVRRQTSSKHSSTAKSASMGCRLCSWLRLRHNVWMVL